MRRVTDGIIRNNYTLVDHTGRKTRWGIWSPDLINHNPFYHGLRAELTGDPFLPQGRRTHHRRPQVCRGCRRPDQRPSLLAERVTHAPRKRARNGRSSTIPMTSCCISSIIRFLTLEKDPARRRLVVESIARTWEEIEGEQSIRPEHNPFYNFIYGATTGLRCDVEEARATLQDWPWDLIAWSTKNSHRHDVSIRTAPGFRRNQDAARSRSFARRTYPGPLERQSMGRRLGKRRPRRGRRRRLDRRLLAGGLSRLPLAR